MPKRVVLDEGDIVKIFQDPEVLKRIVQVARQAKRERKVCFLCVDIDEYWAERFPLSVQPSHTDGERLHEDIARLENDPKKQLQPVFLVDQNGEVFPTKRPLVLRQAG